jgi:hypothetical protein
MNDRQRLAALTAAQRLLTLQSSLPLTPQEFVKKRRAMIDEVLQPFAELAVKPRRAKVRWRQWSDLTAKKQARILDFLARRGWRDWDKIHLELTRRQIKSGGEGDDQVVQVPRYTPPIRRRYGEHGGFKVYDWGYSAQRCPPRRMLKEGSLTDRLHRKRLSAVRNIQTGQGWHGSLVPTFLPDLHPDDVELATQDDAVAVTLDRQFRKLEKLLSCSARYEGGDIMELARIEQPLAVTLSLTDPLTKCEVYYCALLELHRSAPPTLCRMYVGRAWDISTKSWRITGRFKRAANALQAAIKLYGDGAARVVHQEEPTP